MLKKLKLKVVLFISTTFYVYLHLNFFKVRLLFSEVIEAGYKDKVRLSDI